MRIALLIAGQARFCEAFDVQLASLKNYDSIDWFVTLWNTPGDSCKPIAMNWQNIDNNKVRVQIEKRLPPNHTLVHVDVREQSSCPPYPYSMTPADDRFRMWQQYSILRWCDNARQDHEKLYGKYDMVIRSRPDIAIINDVDLAYWGNIISQNPKNIILPYPDRGGPCMFNDQFALCSSDGMTDYTSAIDKWMEMHIMYNMEFTPETLIGAILYKKGYSWPPTNFNSPALRLYYGHWKNGYGSVWIGNPGTWG